MMSSGEWLCEHPECGSEAIAVVEWAFGRADLCPLHAQEVTAPACKPQWFYDLFGVRRPRRELVRTALECEGVGVVVHGSVYSVELAFKDAVRHGQKKVALLSDAGLLEVETAIEWDLTEVRRAER